VSVNSHREREVQLGPIAQTGLLVQVAQIDLTEQIVQVVQVVRIPVVRVVLPQIVRRGQIVQVDQTVLIDLTGPLAQVELIDLTGPLAQVAQIDLTEQIVQVVQVVQVVRIPVVRVVLPQIVRRGQIVQVDPSVLIDLTGLLAQVALIDLTERIVQVVQVVQIPVVRVVLPQIVRRGLIIQVDRSVLIDLTGLLAQVELIDLTEQIVQVVQIPVVQVVRIRSVQISNVLTIRGKALEVLASKYDSLLLDLDGVVYQGSEAIVNAVESINKAASLSIQVGYLTNNSSRRAETIAEQLIGFGIQAAADQVVGSASAGVMLLAKKIPAGAKVLVVGGDGLKHAVAESGFEVVDHASHSPAAVIQGFSPDVSWRELAQASFAIQGGAIWIATNQDWTVPVEQGIAPGNGTLVGAVHTAVGILPEIAGKPFRPIFEQALLQLGIKNPLMVGDRLDTDIRGANNSGLDSAVVMTGIVTRKELLAAGKEDRPKFILQDLSGLFDAYHDPKSTKRGAKSGDSTVELLGDRVVIVSGNPQSLDTLKAACHVIWTSGRPIYSLDVDASIYS
jgi:HAD superfamily hydrolase (TIGR01450 family)